MAFKDIHTQLEQLFDKIKFEDFVLDIDMLDEFYIYMREEMLAYLLYKEVVFLNSRSYICPFAENPQPETIVAFVNSNDIFGPGADGDSVSIDELPELCSMCMADNCWGSVKWACMKRKTKPWNRVVQRMKEQGAWESWMDELDE